MKCVGWESDTVLFAWDDNASGELWYEVERSIDGEEWVYMWKVEPNDDGNYGAYKDLGIDTSKNYRYKVRAYYSEGNYSPYSEVCENRRIYEPDNFRIFYGVLGEDDCPKIDGKEACLTDKTNGNGTNTYVALTNYSLTSSADAFTRLGFTRPADEPIDGLDKIPINVMWCDSGGCAGGGGLGISPEVLETPYNGVSHTGDPIAYLVGLHELWHFLQAKYGWLDDPAGDWVIEGQARSIQDKVCLGGDRYSAWCFDDIATGFAGYVGQVKAYLADPEYPLINQSYSAALFWTYLTEKFGTEEMDDEAEMGMDFIRRFWEEAATNNDRDGVTILNATLESMGYSERFEDIWKDFAVASYAKDYSGPDKYMYADMAQTGGDYGPPLLTIDDDLTIGETIEREMDSVSNWGAKYYEVRPGVGVSLIRILSTQDEYWNELLYYTVLGIHDGGIVYEYNTEAINLTLDLPDDDYDKVALIVAGLEGSTEYNLSIAGIYPEVRLLSPIAGAAAMVGDSTAPGKFLVRMEVLSGEDVLQVTGLDLDQFAFRVGGEDVTADHILAKYQFMGQQWFLLRAPIQTEDDADETPHSYDLQVYYPAASGDSQDDAVDYTPRNSANSMILLDRSLSMGEANKLFYAGSAAKLFVDSWHTGDQIGLITFNEAITVDVPLSPWSDTYYSGSRDQIFNVINYLTADGYTCLGDTLMAGYDQLAASGDPTHDWALVLLSDGVETHPGTYSFDEAITNIRLFRDKSPVIHSVAVGSDADRPRMQLAASATGGTYNYISETAKVYSLDGVTDIEQMGLAMDYRYRLIASDIQDYQSFFNFVGPYTDTIPSQDVVEIDVESGADEMVLSLGWDTYLGNVYLRDPEGTVVNSFQDDTKHMVWRVAAPQDGIWTLEVNELIISDGAQAEPESPSALPNYLVQASLKTEVAMEVFITTPVEERVPGHPIRIAAMLMDDGPMTGGLIWAAVEKPSGGDAVNAWMYDDGEHDDGEAGDGVYAGIFYQTAEQGSYNVTVNAYVDSPSLGESIERHLILSFHTAFVDGNGDEIFYGDADGDGLPDGWEIYWFGDTSTYGNADDPDHDGLTNVYEMQNGTNPLDPDMDDDGEADSTDDDPSEPSDDPLPAPWGKAYAGSEQIWVNYALDPSYTMVELYRDEDDDADDLYEFITLDVPPIKGVFIDTAVTDGHEYCYVIAVTNTDGQLSTFSAPMCAKPSADPMAPHGFVEINGGNPTTASAEVTLTLWASDEIDPSVEYPGSDDFLPPDESASGVTEMIVSNYADFRDASWEAYDISKPWTLLDSDGLATVYVKFRDAYGNESELAVATIYIGTGPLYQSFFVPVVNK